MTKKGIEGKPDTQCRAGNTDIIDLHGWGRIFISNVTGFTRGLKHDQLRRIEKLSTRRVAQDQIVSPELARQLSELSHETGRQIGVLLNRKGQVEYVMVGTASRSRSRLGPLGIRRPFSRIGGVHTHLPRENDAGHLTVRLLRGQCLHPVGPP